MSMKKLFLFFALAGMVAACGSSGIAPLEFETYEKEANVDDPESPPSELMLKFDIPKGEGDLQNKVTEGIREIIKQSEVGTALGQSMGGSLKEIADGFADYFAKGETEPAFYNLEILHGFQNQHAITFHVIDGIYMNGGPKEFNKVVRLSDGHLMTAEEMFTITENQVKELVKQFGDDDQKELADLMEEGGYWLAPDTLGCKLIFQNGSHFFNYVDIPLKDIAPYLTEEGGVLFEVPADAQQKPTENPEVVDEVIQEVKDYALDNGKLGPVEIGKNIADLPEAVEGLYDKSEHKKEVHESDMEDDWTEEYYIFTKDGKEVFRTDVEGKKIVSVVLLEGASSIKTSDGFYVGCSAQELFKAKKMQWENYFEGNVFATSGHYTYLVNSDDLVNTDIPEKASDFKSTAKVIRIIYR